MIVEPHQSAWDLADQHSSDTDHDTQVDQYGPTMHNGLIEAYCLDCSWEVWAQP